MAIVISQPAPSSGFSKDEHEGHLVLFIGTEKKEGATQFGDDTWAQCQWVSDLDSPSLDVDVSIFGKVLAPSIYGAGDVVVGRLRKEKRPRRASRRRGFFRTPTTLTSSPPNDSSTLT